MSCALSQNCSRRRFSLLWSRPLVGGAVPDRQHADRFGALDAHLLLLPGEVLEALAHSMTLVPGFLLGPEGARMCARPAIHAMH